MDADWINAVLPTRWEIMSLAVGELIFSERVMLSRVNPAPGLVYECERSECSWHKFRDY